MFIFSGLLLLLLFIRPGRLYTYYFVCLFWLVVYLTKVEYGYLD